MVILDSCVDAEMCLQAEIQDKKETKHDTKEYSNGLNSKFVHPTFFEDDTVRTLLKSEYYFVFIIPIATQYCSLPKT